MEECQPTAKALGASESPHSAVPGGRCATIRMADEQIFPEAIDLSGLDDAAGSGEMLHAER